MEKTVMKVFGNAKSRTFRVLWTLEEVGVRYEHIDLDFRKGEHLTPEFLQINPYGKVPALQHGDLRLFETAAICTYIGEFYPDRELIPPTGTSERALYHQWISFITTELEMGLWTMAKHKFALPKEQRLDAMRAVGAWEYARAAPVLSHALENQTYLVGDQFGIADIFAAHTLLWARGFEVPLGSPRLESYLDHLMERQAFQKVYAMRNA